MITDTLRLISPLARTLRSRIAALVGLAFVTGLCEAAALMLTVRVILLLTRQEIDDGDVSLFGVDLSPSASLGAAVVLAVIAAALHYVIAKRAGALTAETMYSARRRVVGDYLHASWAAQSAEREGALQEAATTLASRIAAVVQATALGATQTAVLITFGVIAFVVDPLATLLVIAAGIVLQFVVRPMARRTASSTRGSDAPSVARRTAARCPPRSRAASRAGRRRMRSPRT